MTRTLHHHDHDHDRHHGQEQEDAPARVDPVTLRLAFDVAVDQLTAPGVHTITRENGSTDRAVSACLLDQLVAATQPGGERVGGGTGPGSRPPASLNALTVVAEIGTEMRRQITALGYHIFGPGPRWRLSRQVRLWASHAEQWQFADVDYLAHAAEQTQRWVTAARGVLEPEPRYRLRGHACPVCRETTVLVWSDVEAEWVRQAALSIDTDRVEAVCAACDTRWTLDHWAQLGRTLEDQRRETLAVDCE